jgi:hypothetical protein
MGFFSTKSSHTEAEEKLLRTLETQKQEIKQKLENVRKLNLELARSVQETQVQASSLMKKLKSELKIAKKSFTSFTKKIHSGVIIIDHAGDIVQLNAAGEELFNISEADVIGKSFINLITVIEPILIVDTHDRIEFSSTFFDDLSKQLLNRMSNCDDRDEGCRNRLEEILPKFLKQDEETEINCFSPCRGETLKLLFTFSILDNDPIELNDLIYVFVFRRATKRRSIT